MTPCTRYPDDEAVVRYVTGDLTEADRSAFEDHLFACDSCLARVERFQQAQQVLRGRRLPDLPTAVPAAVADATPSRGQRLPWWVMTAVAAGLVAGLAALVLWTGSGRMETQEARTSPTRIAADTDVAPASSQVGPRTGSGGSPEVSRGSSPAGTRGGLSPDGRGGLSQPPEGASRTGALQVAVLAMVTPPPYLPITTRGDAGGDERFRTGMEAYVRADWAAASRALRDVPTPQARFYLGVADLMRGETGGAVTALDASRDSGAQPYARESLFYLGKAALLRGDVDGARRWFAAARGARATTASEAARLLDALDDIRPE